MTLIQPQAHSNLFPKLFGIFCALFLATVVWLIFLYTSTVSLRHETSQLREDLQKFQIESAAIKDQMFALLGSQNLQSLSESRNLVRDSSPRYINLQPTWEVASRF